jgi:pyochelin biosynthesis protein PchC
VTESSGRRPRWVRRLGSTLDPAVHLVCFPHAGGTFGFYRGLAPLMPKTVALSAVQYPGRQDRLREPAFDDVRELAAALAARIADDIAFDGLPMVLFGHSMGATIAFETALRLCEGHAIRPACVVVSSAVPTPKVSAIADDDAKILHTVRRLGAVNPDILDDPDMLALILPSLRTDYRALERYVPTPGVRIDTPIIVYIGADDPDIPSEMLSEWAYCTSKEVTWKTFPGGHFYLDENPEPVVSDLVERLTALGVLGE